MSGAPARLAAATRGTALAAGGTGLAARGMALAAGIVAIVIPASGVVTPASAAVTPASAAVIPVSAAAEPAPTPRARLALARPEFSAPVTARAGCGTFTGTVQHGGDGSVLFPAFLTVAGRVSSTCAQAITARVGYQLDFVHQGPFTLGRAAPGRTVTIRRLHRQTRLATSYQDIFIQVCSGGRRPACGRPVHV